MSAVDVQADLLAARTRRLDQEEALAQQRADLDRQYERRGLQRRDEVRRLRLRDVDQWHYRELPAQTRLDAARRAWSHLYALGLMSELVDEVLRQEAVA